MAKNYRMTVTRHGATHTIEGPIANLIEEGNLTSDEIEIAAVMQIGDVHNLADVEEPVSILCIGEGSKRATPVQLFKYVGLNEQDLKDFDVLCDMVLGDYISVLMDKNSITVEDNRAHAKQILRVLFNLANQLGIEPTQFDVDGYRHEFGL